jgi:hypothetical protein
MILLLIFIWIYGPFDTRALAVWGRPSTPDQEAGWEKGLDMRLTITRGAAMTLALVGVLATGGRATAQTTYPVLDAYAALGQRLTEAAREARSPDALLQVYGGTRDLVALGLQIMALYEARNPVCAEQYAAFRAALPGMVGLSAEDVHARYHNGTGLPSAPRHCYLGRSEVVHPVLNLIRLQGPWTEEVRAKVVHDFEEVVEHLPRIARNLDTPPG